VCSGVVIDVSEAAVPDGVVCAQTDPLGDGAILLLRFRKLLLGAEGLLGLRGVSSSWIGKAEVRKSVSYRHRDCW
jgi:hypothetical protein